MDLERISEEARLALSELSELANLKADDLLIIGCSTSEVKGERIGSATSLDIAEALFAGFCQATKHNGIALAFQCCEHINRAVVLPYAHALRLGLAPVQVIPVPHAGGAMAAIAFQQLPQAVVVENINSLARAGLDIGDTLIGMHIRPVVVPLRLQKQKTIGAAHLHAAYSRPKLIGGQRAVYDPEKALQALSEAGYRKTRN